MLYIFLIVLFFVFGKIFRYLLEGSTLRTSIVRLLRGLGILPEGFKLFILLILSSIYLLVPRLPGIKVIILMCFVSMVVGWYSRIVLKSYEELKSSNEKVSFWTNVGTLISLIFVIWGFYNSIEQGREMVEQSKSMAEINVESKRSADILFESGIFELADRAKWNFLDGGDIYSLQRLKEYTDQKKYSKTTVTLALAQLNKAQAANNNIYITVDEFAKANVCWYPQQGKNEGCGLNVSTGHLIGLMKSQNHWLVRAGAARLLGDVSDEKIKIDGESKENIAKELNDRIINDPSVAVVLTATASYRKVHP